MGGTTVFDDFNLYAYQGGSVKTRIGDNILSLFRDRIDETFADRCWLTVGPENKRIWLFYVPDNKEFMTKAFTLDIQQGKWMPRDFSHITDYAGNKGTPTGGGLTTAKLVGSQTFVTGDSYATAVAGGQTYAQAVTATDTYADVLNIVFSGDKLTIGDSNGNVYQFDEALPTDDGTNIPCVHYTPEFDGAEIDKLKRWIDHQLTAKGDGVIVEYSTDGGTWTDITATPQVLTGVYEEYEHYINNSSKRIQFRYRNDGSG